MREGEGEKMSKREGIGTDSYTGGLVEVGEGKRANAIISFPHLKFY